MDVIGMRLGEHSGLTEGQDLPSISPTFNKRRTKRCLGWEAAGWYTIKDLVKWLKPLVDLCSGS
jgi:hypothetical protein